MGIEISGDSWGEPMLGKVMEVPLSIWHSFHKGIFNLLFEGVLFMIFDRLYLII
jgi:hypothetical protein